MLRDSHAADYVTACEACCGYAQGHADPACYQPLMMKHEPCQVLHSVPEAVPFPVMADDVDAYDYHNLATALVI